MEKEMLVLRQDVLIMLVGHLFISCYSSLRCYALYLLLNTMICIVSQAAAAKAKKRGKMLHRHELHLFWQRKKQSESNCPHA